MPDLFCLLAQQVQPQGLLGLIDRIARTPLSQVVIFVAICTIIRMALFPYLLKKPKHLRMGAYTYAKWGNEFLDAVIYAGVFVFLIIRPFLVQTFYIPSGSMLQTLQLNDYIIANKLIYRYTEPQLGDIVVFKPPKRALFEGQGETDFIKRLQGRPGDVVEWVNYKLIRNGKEVDEPYVDFTEPGTTRSLSPDEARDPMINKRIDFRLVKYKDKLIPLNIVDGIANPGLGVNASEYNIPPEDQEMVKRLPAEPIPPGYYLFMGDNRNGSFDGRGWGLVPRDAIIGRSEFIWMPIRRIQRTR